MLPTAGLTLTLSVPLQEPSLDIPMISSMPPSRRSRGPYKAEIAVSAGMGLTLSAVQSTPSVAQIASAGIHSLQKEHGSAEGLKVRKRKLPQPTLSHRLNCRFGVGAPKILCMHVRQDQNFAGQLACCSSRSGHVER